MTQGIMQDIKPGFTWNAWTEQPILKPVASDEFEYLLVIHPDMEVFSKVVAERQQFNTLYKTKDPRSKPHITLAGFVARESMEETLIRWIQRVCSGQKGFNVTLNNYSGIPPHTVYLRVQDHLPFSLLTQKLVVINEYIQSNGCPPVRWNSRPHLSFSGELTEEVYERAMRDYAHRSFCETFMASELVLLRKSAGDGWKIINIFGLLPQ
jgi:hypothetical protein